MSSYLVSFLISDFQKVSAPKSNVIIWAKPQLKNYLSYSSAIAAKAMKFLAEMTQVEYPLDEMNVIAIPDFSGEAMENWGLMSFAYVEIIKNLNTYQIYA